MLSFLGKKGYTVRVARYNIFGVLISLRALCKFQNKSCSFYKSTSIYKG